MEHTWTAHASSPHYSLLAGHKDALVRTSPMPKGYLWQFGKRCGYAPTEAEARDWVETLAEVVSVPKGKRWVQLSSVFA